MERGWREERAEPAAGEGPAAVPAVSCSYIRRGRRINGMKIAIESTSEIVNVNGADCRVWEGETASGVKVQALIHVIAVHKDQDTSQFESELREQSPPRAEERAFPLRMLI